jgi:hypothetical protein
MVAGELAMNFAIVNSVDVCRQISTEELHDYTTSILSSVLPAGILMPPILIMHVSECVAAMVGVTRTGVIRHNHSTSGELRSYYEIWLVGSATLGDYILALQGIIDEERSFGCSQGPLLAS